MKNVLYSANDKRPFEFEKFKKSLKRYGFEDDELLKETLKKWDQYTDLHYSCLIETAVNLIPEESEAKRYYEEHQHSSEGGFERLRRITGYLVGSLERWNDGKIAEERDRVKHNVTPNANGVYSQEEKAIIECVKGEQLHEQQNEYHK